MAQSLPIISVLMSTYKENPKYVTEAIDSILNQTLKNFEFIIINDLPQDKCLDVLINSYNDSRIRYFRNKENIGLAASMNRAASLARADILARMDADDIAVPDRFEKQLAVLNLNRNCDFVCGRFTTIDDSGNIISPSAGDSYAIGTNIAKKVQITPSIIHHPTVMFRRNFFDKVGGYRNFPCAQDLDLWMRMAEAGCCIYYMQDILIRYRLNSNSITHKKHLQQQLTIHYSYKLSLERMINGKDSFSMESYSRYLQKFGLGDKQKEIKLEKLHELLRLKGCTNTFKGKFRYYRNRIVVFTSYSSLRNYYINKLKKKALLCLDKHKLL